MIDWTADRCLMQKKIEDSFARRNNPNLIENHRIPQMKRNLSDEGL